MSKRTVEVMAPVGSFESLRAAFQGGADAVYFGMGYGGDNMSTKLGYGDYYEGPCYHTDLL